MGDAKASSVPIRGKLQGLFWDELQLTFSFDCRDQTPSSHQKVNAKVDYREQHGFA
jgi:hypothetical protein